MSIFLNGQVIELVFMIHFCSFSCYFVRIFYIIWACVLSQSIRSEQGCTSNNL